VPYTPYAHVYRLERCKDEYTFDFLELVKEHSEQERERALIARIEDFLRARGGMFAFMGSQYRLEVDGDEYFIDLLMFYRRLKALVAIELKIGKFMPEFVGKMQFYLTALHDARNPPISLPSRMMGWGIPALRERHQAHRLRDSRKFIPK
jgi:hypothetical protein